MIVRYDFGVYARKIQKWLMLCAERTVQCVLIALELFNKNGLANHAAAAAYSFLFSAAPGLLIVAFIILEVFKTSPETAAALFGNMGLLNEAFDINDLTETFLSASRPGIAGFISIVGLLWTARIFALSLQRGLKIIFPAAETVSPMKKIVSPIAIEAAVLLLAFFTIFTSETALFIYQVFEIFSLDQPWFAAISRLLGRYSPLVMAGFLIYLGYTFVPAKTPRRSAALTGTIFCTGLFSALIFMSRFIINEERYGIIYGTLGNLLVLLVNVYFFFILFFLGAELTFILNSFDALLLSRFIQTGSMPEKKSFAKRWVTPTGAALKEYIRFYEKEEVVFSKGGTSSEIYYIISGEAAVYLDEGAMIDRIEHGKFFGEMGHLLSEGRSATVKAHTDLKVLIIPPALFQEVLKYSKDMDQKIITLLSERLRNLNAKFSVGE
jgi:membrane protein